MTVLIIKHLPNQDYAHCFDAMKARIDERVMAKKAGKHTANELWLVEHQDVYTLGLAGKRKHILTQTDTPIIQTDRGGQVTWHGKGQLVAYFLFDLNMLGWSVRKLVTITETMICDVLTPYLTLENLSAKPKPSAPGVYVYDSHDVELGKIASLGFKIKHGFCYHGLAINLNCDLAVFDTINPCGHAGMTMLNLADFAPMSGIARETTIMRKTVENALIDAVKEQLAQTT